MVSSLGIPIGGRQRAAECACGLTSRGPWGLVAHLLSVYPPSVDMPLDGERHADATRLSVKFSTGSFGAWEIVTWASHQRKDLRVAAAIVCKVKDGGFRPYQEIRRKEICDTYKVSMHVVGAAMGILREIGVVRKYGSRNNIQPHDIEETLNRHSLGTMFNLIARHVANLEDRLAEIGDD
jgi:hypothetical protein